MRAFKTPVAQVQANLLRFVCGLVLLCTLTAGLWPFHAPRNDVQWLHTEDGIIFGEHGSIVSAGVFNAAQFQVSSSCSVEIWLKPDRVDSAGTILAFYWPEGDFVPFSLRQSLGDLEIQHVSRTRPPGKTKLYINAFSSLTPVFVSITSGESGLAVYLGGSLVRKVSGLSLSSRDLSGRLVIGNAPNTTDSWSGELKGLAFYDRELEPAEVTQHFVEWTKENRPYSSAARGVVASYLLGEGNGSVIHSQVDSAPDLLIPKRFFVLREQFLERPWDEFHSDWAYCKDVAINIGGLIPLGFFFNAYFSVLRNFRRATWLTVALGLLVSLTIEVFQAFLPTRDSGMTDLITNTLGTALGAALFLQGWKRHWLDRLIFVSAW